jgi:CheY-like chemotaxis protein
LQDWDAITLVEQLRLREAGGSHAPVLAITTEEEPKAVYMKCLAVGVNGFVERTVERERLSAVAGVFLRLVEEPANVEAPRC